MKPYNSEQDIIQNLKDAGCNNNQIKEIVELYKNNNLNQINKLLSKHRDRILRLIHKNEKKIICLDYFIYQIEKGNKNE